MAAVFHHAEEDVAQFGFALGIAMPFCKHCWRHLNIAPQLFCRMTAQKEPVEKCSLTLRIFEIQRDFRGNELCHRGHGERAVYRKASPRQVVPRLSCRVQVKASRFGRSDATFAPRMQRGDCRAVLIVLGWIEDGAIARHSARFRGWARREPRASVRFAPWNSLYRSASRGFPPAIGGQARPMGA